MLSAITVFVLLSSGIVSAQECHDLDTTGCVLMSKQRPDICSDPTLSKTACPKFCKLCQKRPVPMYDNYSSEAIYLYDNTECNCEDNVIFAAIECYQCNATVEDYHLCSTTISCPQGHMCMRKELKSVVDGHHEYEMTCASSQECDDPWNSLSVFGKRYIVSRDVSVTCCGTHLCNYPGKTTLPPPTPASTTIAPSTTTTTTTTTTTRPTSGCIIDLVFVVDESNSLIHYGSSIQQFLQHVVTRLPVSDSEVHVALGLFSMNSRAVFNLDDYHSKSDVLRAISTVTLHGGSGDINEGLIYVKDHALTPAAGDRPTAPNVVVIINDDATRNLGNLSLLEYEVRNIATVISVEIGHFQFAHLASDTNHKFHLSSPSDLVYVDALVSDLIC